MDKIRSCYLGRVSTIQKSQESSLINQREQIVDYILKQPNEIFNPEKDCFEDKITGTKIKKNNDNAQGFDKLMELLGLKIEDTNSKDNIEISIKATRNIKPKYNKIYCKSTSRINRAGSKGQSLIEVLKELGIEVYYFDLQKSTFQMSQEELTLYTLFDNKYSRTMSFNTRNNKMLKNKNRELLLHGERFGWDLIKKNHHRYYVKNEKEYEAIRLMVKMILDEDKGCSLIEQKLQELDYKTKRNTYLDRSQINKILKDRHYLGEEKYYFFPKEYVSQFMVDRDYLKSLNFQWIECEYIEQLISQEEFDLIQDKLQSRTSNHRGFRNPYTAISKKLVCGCCEKHFYSLGKSNYFKINSYKCSSKRAKEKYNPCENNTLYEDFLNEWLEKKAKKFYEEKREIYRENLTTLLHLKTYLALILIKDNKNKILDKLTTKKEQLEYEIRDLLKKSFLESSKNIVDEMLLERDIELKKVNSELANYLELENVVKERLEIIDSLYEQLLESYSNEKKIYTGKEYLEELEYIYIYPKSNTKRHRNNIVLIPSLKITEEIFRLLDNIFNSDIVSFLEPHTFKAIKDLQGRKKYLIKVPSKEQEEKAKSVIENLYV